MISKKIEKTLLDLLAVADVDFIDVSFIAESLREDIGLKSQEDIRLHTLNVVNKLMDENVYPGDYDHASTISFWEGTKNEILDRIEAEWIAIGHTPTLEHPICWFRRKTSDLD